MKAETSSRVIRYIYFPIIIISFLICSVWFTIKAGYKIAKLEWSDIS